MQFLTPEEKYKTIQHLETTIALVRAMPANRDCRLCMHFKQDSNDCSLHNFTIPQESIASGAVLQGCDAWEWMPF